MRIKATCWMLAAAAMVVAQPPEGGRGKGKGQGQRPGGLTFAATVYNSPEAIVRILELGDVQTELKFSTEDRAALPLLRDELKEGDDKFITSLRESGQDRDAFRAKLAERSKEVDKQVQEVLGDRFGRFKEIRRQILGIQAAASADAEVREGLAITEDQRTKINDARNKASEEWRNQWRQDRGQNPGGERPKVDAAEAGKRGAEFRVIEEKVFMDQLTDAQKAKWKELAGSPIAYKVSDDFVAGVMRGSFEVRGRGGPAGGGDRPRRGKRGENPPDGEKKNESGAEKKPPAR